MFINVEEKKRLKVKVKDVPEFNHNNMKTQGVKEVSLHALTFNSFTVGPLYPQKTNFCIHRSESLQPVWATWRKEISLQVRTPTLR
jgi:hypothetical protein